MPIFYSDSASFSTLEVSSSLLVSGSLILTGSLTTTGGGFTGSYTGSLTGSLLGTASWAISASWAPGGGTTTGSFTGSFTGSLLGTASWAISSSYALVAQTLLGSIASASYAATASMSTGGNFSGSFSGSFQGNGAGLTGVVASAAPGGANKTIQFNKSGATSGSGNFTWDDTLNIVNITGSLQITATASISSSLPTNTVLYLVGNNNTASILVLDTYNSSQFGSSIRGRRARGTATSPSAVQTNDVLLQLAAQGYGVSDGTGSFVTQGSIAFFAAETWTTQSQGTYATLRVTNVGSTSSIDAIRINPNRDITLGGSGSANFLFISSSGQLLINSASLNPLAPQTLVVQHANTSSYNAVTIYGTVDNYLQQNIQNFSNGATASSDYVATNDIGTETSYFIDMGINSSNFVNSGSNIGTGSDAYLYSTGNNLYVGNLSTDKKMFLFSGRPPGGNGEGADIIIENNVVSISGSLTVAGEIQGVQGQILALVQNNNLFSGF